MPTLPIEEAIETQDLIDAHANAAKKCRQLYSEEITDQRVLQGK